MFSVGKFEVCVKMKSQKFKGVFEFWWLKPVSVSPSVGEPLESWAFGTLWVFEPGCGRVSRVALVRLGGNGDRPSPPRLHPAARSSAERKPSRALRWRRRRRRPRRRGAPSNAPRARRRVIARSVRRREPRVDRSLCELSSAQFTRVYRFQGRSEPTIRFFF